MRIVEQAILATDLALYFRRKDQFLETANKGEIDWQDQDKKDCKLFDFLLLWPSSCLFFLEFASHDLKCMGKCFGSKVFPRKIVNFDNFLMQKVSSLILEVFVKKSIEGCKLEIT